MLAVWPGELKGEATALYGSERADALLALRDWRLTPRPHLGFYGASPPQRLYTTTALEPRAYVRSWQEDLDRVHAYALAELREVLWPWLVARRYASADDAAGLPRFERLAGRRAIHLRPAIRAELTVARDPATIRTELAALLDALGEPPLPIASGA